MHEARLIAKNARSNLYVREQWMLKSKSYKENRQKRLTRAAGFDKVEKFARNSR
jgi:hypothetical protein